MKTFISILWHSQVWFVYVVGRIDSSADRFCAPVWELSALKLRPVEQVSWILNTPDFETVSAMIIPVSWCHLDRNKYSRSRLLIVKIISLLKASKTVPQWEFPVPWLVKIHSRREPIFFLVMQHFQYEYPPVLPVVSQWLTAVGTPPELPKKLVHHRGGEGLPCLR